MHIVPYFVALNHLLHDSVNVPKEVIIMTYFCMPYTELTTVQ